MCECKLLFKQALMETDGSGAPHARVRAAVLPVHCVALCVCVLLRVCSSLRACATAVSVSTATGIGAAAPDGIRERSASRQSLESLGNTPPDNAEANRRHFVFYGFFNAGLTHCFLYCFLYCLIKNTLIFLTVHCGHSGRTLHCNQ